jgi:hypothetical protein
VITLALPQFGTHTKYILLYHTPDQFTGRSIKRGEIYRAFSAIALLMRNDRILDHLRWSHSRQEVMDLIAEADRAAAVEHLFFT